ncbi:MAG: hypothetical protein HY077_17785 [Elusimicrobia bacterium]|nr:hypothetical protein [Elusimicrobiota bacterium]
MPKRKSGARRSRAELARLQKRLKTEVARLKARRPKDPGELAQFEASHARLTEAVNEICGFLANLGI